MAAFATLRDMTLPALTLTFVIYLGLMLAKWRLARRYARNVPFASAATNDFSQVTILQPVVSGDARLEEMLHATLASFPRSPLIWIVDDDDAPAHELCAA